MKKATVFFLTLVTALPAFAQMDRGAGDSKAATGGARPPQMNEGFIGRDIPAFDPGSEVAMFDGKIWNINNNRLVRARFEKYLNAPAATSQADVAYRKTIDRILELLAPGNATPQNIDAAFELLPQASDYRDDANLCRTMADAIYAARTAQKTVANLKRENVLLDKKRETAEWNKEMSVRDTYMNAPSIPKGGESSAAIGEVWKDERKLARNARMATANRRLGDLKQTIENNKLRIAITEISAKAHLQALIMQYFATRRFEHVLIANRFYRAIYNDGDNSIDVYKQMVGSMPVNKDAGQAKINAELDPKVAAAGVGSESGGGVRAGTGTNGTGAGAGVHTGTPSASGGSMAASGGKVELENFSVESLTGGAAVAAQTISKLVSSLSQIDSLANEAIRDVNEGIEAYKFLLEQGELNSATERLAETFVLGEYLPSVRLLPRTEKRRALEFTQKSNELLAALEVNDLSLAEKLVGEISGMARDFNVSKPTAKIETAKTISSMHLAKARNAAVAGDKATLETELRAATEIWPRNPDLATVSSQIFKQTDVQLQAMQELDQLIEHGDYRAVYRDAAKFTAAVATDPERQANLKGILDKMTKIETELQRAREFQQRGNAIGAWESIESASKAYPDDTEINRLRADLASGGAATFVRSLNKGADLESRGEYGPALALYLDAHGQYPASKMAQERIDELSARILPAKNVEKNAPDEDGK